MFKRYFTRRFPLPWVRALVVPALLLGLSACSTLGGERVPVSVAGGGVTRALVVPPVRVNPGPHIQTWTTTNGAKVLFIASPGLPLVDVRVVFDAGSARDGSSPGLAAMTNTLLAQGAGGRNADAIAARFDSLGAEFGLSAERDMALLSLRTLTAVRILKPAIAQLAAILQRPDFPAGALARERRQALIALREQRQSPGAIAIKAFYRAIYGRYPYGSPVLGTAASVRHLTRARLEAFYHRYYVGRNAIVAIVGDISRARAQRLAQQVVGGLPDGEHAPALPPVPPLKAALSVERYYPSTQTHILMGQPGVRRGSADYFALYLGNYILGGSGLGSRIMKNIREKRGLAYSAYSYFLPLRQDGPFLMGVQTRTDRAGESQRLLHQTLVRFIEQGPSKAEMVQAKAGITGGFPLRIDSNRKLVGYIAMIGFYGLPLDYLQQFNRRIAAVTRAQIMRAFKQRIHPNRLVSVVVGANVKSTR